MEKEIELILPQDTHIIEEGAFKNCTSLTSADLPASVRHLGNHVFYGCTSLAEQTIQ